MNKTKKTLASLAIAGMTLSMLPFNAFASGTVPTRLAGTTAAQTAATIADQTGWTGTAVLASSASYGMVDALTSGPLATFLNAPILLQEPGNVLNADTKAELTKLNVKTVYVTSGTAVISQAVLDQLKGMGITVVPLGGADRFETSVNIAKKMVTLGAPVSKVAVAYGWLNQDALSIASIASASNEPILLTERGSVPASVQAFLTANTSIISSDVIGGTGVISDAVKAAFPDATRHAGNTAYDTNNQVIQDFSSSLEFNNVYVANGVTGIDALAGAPLAAQTKSAIVLTDGTVPAAATFVHSKLAAGSVVTALGGSAVVSDSVLTGVVNGTPTPAQGNLAVTSVSAISASSFKVVFNQAPADTSKVTFTVQRSTTPVTVTMTWNAAKTEATVSSASNLPEGSYTVAVKNDTTDLGTSTVAISAQKVAKINITSTKLSITSANVGYATYNVLDQYGNDITTSSLANSLTFQSGAGTVTINKGLLKLDPGAGGQNLMQSPSISITGYDSTSGVSTNATLTTSSALGTLSNMTLNTLSNANGKVLTDGDTSSVFYIDYTATDVSGNATKDYDLVVNGLITNTISGNQNCLTTSNSNVLAQVVTDPSDSNKAAIKVTVVGNSNLSMDLPVTITAMSYSGTTSTLNVTLKKAATVDTFTLMVPAYDIAVNEQKEIPFTAFDQNGVALTKKSDLTGITFTGATLDTNIDGTAVLKNNSQSVDGPMIITAMTSTGKFSSITINIQKAVKADTLSVDSSILVSAMQAGAAQKIDFGYDKGGLSVKDQYGRLIDMTGGTDTYEVLAVSSDNTIVSTTGPAKVGQNPIMINAVKTGTATVNFQLVAIADPTKVINSQSVTFSVIKNDDIKGYTVDAVANPIYANADLTAITGRDTDYHANPKVYGATASGTKVLLGGTPIIGAFVDNTKDFAIETPVGAYDTVKVIAGKLANNVTDSTTNLTVTILGTDGTVKSLTTPIKSSTAAPVASTLVAKVDSSVPGVSVSSDGTTATVSVASGVLAPNKVMARFNAAGSSTDRAAIYFYALDQYGTKGMKLAQITKVASGSTLTNDQFNVNSDGTITGTGAVAGGTVTLTGVTSNGLIKTIKVIFN
ncbi:cell wall-binding repeat-containing protein [Desulfosporosinus sp. Sb-LF]|uniref:cell wall-binding repeat-containing protein n=1 Tax=Desulfosporosinus sp. Sb-LF TaxID=2560027 RepID=UPI00107EFC8D|nr:cell wall-binding repeat-containing protein [Desulfosporosinus sp. Sb-LF]TGE31864.1 cell wall-binding repeat-containing protein [Desulfosporosinus sp. Sb-LF]